MLQINAYFDKIHIFGNKDDFFWDSRDPCLGFSSSNLQSEAGLPTIKAIKSPKLQKIDLTAQARELHFIINLILTYFNFMTNASNLIQILLIVNSFF